MSLPQFLFGKHRRGGLPGGGALDREGWQVGDLAECVGCGVWRDWEGREVPGPEPRQVLKVTGVIVGRTLGERQPVLGLTFAAWPGQHWIARAFRKLNPRADEATPAEAEFTALVKRKPAPALTPRLPGETIEEHQ